MRSQKTTRYLYNLKDRQLPASIGNKAKYLHLLAHKGYLVPISLVCTWEAYHHYLEDEQAVIKSLQTELKKWLDPQRSYAIRSSANVEDSLERSFAGQFSTRLNVRSIPAVVQAIQEVWEQTHSPGVWAYLEKHSMSAEELTMAVIIQEMVTPLVSGVAFSKNPLTGMNEVVVEAVTGSGDALVQEGITPARLVYKWGGWMVQPEIGVIDQQLIEQVVKGTLQIARTFKMDVDLEWVYDGEHLYWLQLREITAIKGLKVYSNRIAKEVLPGMIKPLIWSVNTPLVNGAWVNLITEVIGENDLQPESLSKAFYYRTYFDMGTFGRVFNHLGLPEESLEMMMGINPQVASNPPFKPNAKMLILTPRLLAFLFDKWRFSKKVEHELPALEAKFRGFEYYSSGQYDERDLIAAIDRLFKLAQKMAYFNIVVPLLMFFYNALLRRQLGRLGIDYENLELVHGLQALESYSPAIHLEHLSHQFQLLDERLQEQIRQGDYATLKEITGIEGFRQSLADFLEQFGHLSDSGNDFSSTPWRENPDLILKLVLSYAPTIEKGSGRSTFEQLPLSGLRRWWLSILYHRVRQYRLSREQVSSLYTYGYGLFRNYYLELGEILVQNGRLIHPKDIFYLYQEEIQAVFDGRNQDGDLSNLVEQRKVEFEYYQDIELPSLIYGEQAPPVHSTQEDVLYGTATSRGYYTGPVRVVKGIEDFHKVRNGDVLVMPYSDVGWTPLFAKASAVIAESGGMLSHSSIIAREYHIPAVVSVKGAMRLKDNMLVSVDGFRGEVFCMLRPMPTVEGQRNHRTNPE